MKKSTIIAATFLFVMVALTGCYKPDKPARPVSLWQEGEPVAPEVFNEAGSLSAGVSLELAYDKALFFSNTPEMPSDPGILTRVDNIVNPSGTVRVLYSHFNLLIDYSAKPVRNVPAKIGVVFVNNTKRAVDIYHKRLAKGVDQTSDGRRIYSEDLAPQTPGSDVPVYYGAQLGSAVLAGFYGSNPAEEERFWITLKPGQKAWWYDEVAARSWAVGLGDFVLRDHQTGQIIKPGDLGPNEKIGLRSFIANQAADLENFYKATDRPTAVLNQRPDEHLHMRGWFPGPGITRRQSFTYNSLTDGNKSLTFNVKQKAQFHDPQGPAYEPTMFVNDVLKGGIDAYGRVSKGRVSPVAAENNGSYGVDYELTLRIAGPTAIAVQGAAKPPVPGRRPPVDLYNQFLTAMLDNPSRLRTVRLVDPNFFSYYTNYEQLGPLGMGQVVYVLPETAEKTHVLKLGLPPNGYGPFKVMLMPLAKEK